MTESKGYTSLISMVVALVTIVAAKHPEWAWIKTLAANVPAFTDVLNYVLPVLAAIVAGLAHPPAWLRNPIVTVWHILTGRAA